jgi:hypothetical protein
MAVLIALMLMGILGTEVIRRIEVAIVPWKDTA